MSSANTDNERDLAICSSPILTLASSLALLLLLLLRLTHVPGLAAPAAGPARKGREVPCWQVQPAWAGHHQRHAPRVPLYAHPRRQARPQRHVGGAQLRGHRPYKIRVHQILFPVPQQRLGAPTPPGRRLLLPRRRTTGSAVAGQLIRRRGGRPSLQACPALPRLPSLRRATAGWLCVAGAPQDALPGTLILRLTLLHSLGRAAAQCAAAAALPPGWRRFPWHSPWHEWLPSRRWWLVRGLGRRSINESHWTETPGTALAGPAVHSLDAVWAPGVCFTLFVAASVTDWLDGYLARKVGCPETGVSCMCTHDVMASPDTDACVCNTPSCA